MQSGLLIVTLTFIETHDFMWQRIHQYDCYLFRLQPEQSNKRNKCATIGPVYTSLDSRLQAVAMGAKLASSGAACTLYCITKCLGVVGKGKHKLLAATNFALF